MIFANSARIKAMRLLVVRIFHQLRALAANPRALQCRRRSSCLGVAGALTMATLASAAGGCGFQLQGAGVLPDLVATTYLDSANRYTEFHDSLADALTSRGVELTDTRSEAGAVLRILDDSFGQRVLSVSTRNTPQEYEVFYAVGFSLEAGGTALIDNEFLVATRSYSYDATRVLGMSAEEQLLREALAEDLARRVLRRIEGVHPAPANEVTSP